MKAKTESKSSFHMERLLEILQKRDSHEREGTNFTLKQFDGLHFTKFSAIKVDLHYDTPIISNIFQGLVR